MVKKERIFIWDNLKFILIFLVVLGHFADFHTATDINMKRLYLYIYLFHMPLFIFISGLFSKRKRYTKIFEYLILYLGIKKLFFIVDLIINKDTSFSLFNEGGLPWFMLALMWSNLITIFTNKLNPKYLLTVSIILACFIGYDASITDTFAISRTVVFYPFFLSGYLLYQNKVINFYKQNIN